MDLINGLSLVAQDAQEKLEAAVEPVLVLIRSNRDIIRDCRQMIGQLPDPSQINRGFAMDLMAKLVAQGLVPMSAVQQFALDPIRAEEKLSQDQLVELASILQGLAAAAPAPTTAPQGATGASTSGSTTTAAPPPTTDPNAGQTAQPPPLSDDELQAAVTAYVAVKAPSETVEFIDCLAPAAGDTMAIVTFKTARGAVYQATTNALTGKVVHLVKRVLTHAQVVDIVTNVATTEGEVVVVLDHTVTDDQQHGVDIHTVRYHIAGSTAPIFEVEVDGNNGAILGRRYHNRSATVSNDQAVAAVIRVLNQDDVQVRVVGVEHRNMGRPVIVLRYRVGRRPLREAKVDGETGDVLHTGLNSAEVDDLALPRPPGWWATLASQWKGIGGLAILFSLAGWGITRLDVRAMPAAAGTALLFLAAVIMVVALAGNARRAAKRINTPAAGTT